MKILITTFGHQKLVSNDARPPIIWQPNVFNSPTPISETSKEFMYYRALRELGHTVGIYCYHAPTRLSKTLTFISKLERTWQLRGSTQLRRFLERRYRRQVKTNLINAASQYAPDIHILSQISSYLDRATVTALKSVTNSKLILLAGTSPVVTGVMETLQSAPLFDAVFCNDRYHRIQWLELGAKCAVALPITGCDPDSYATIPISDSDQLDFVSEIVFVGQLTPSKFYSERIKVLESLTEFNLAIWSDHEEYIMSNPRLAPHYRGRAHGAKMVKAIRGTMIALNTHGQTMQGGGNIRTFEIPAIGAFQLVDRYDSDWFEEGKEIISYKDIPDLIRKVQHFLAHPEERKAIVRAGQIRAHNNHTYRHRMTEMLDMIASLDVCAESV